MKSILHYKLADRTEKDVEVVPGSVVVDYGVLTFRAKERNDYVGYAPGVWEAFYVEQVEDD